MGLIGVWSPSEKSSPKEEYLCPSLSSGGEFFGPTTFVAHSLLELGCTVAFTEGTAAVLICSGVEWVKKALSPPISLS